VDRRQVVPDTRYAWAMVSSRLLKVSLPASTVDALDRALEQHPTRYADRSAFVHDAVENLLAELDAEAGAERTPAASSFGSAVRYSPEAATDRLFISAPSRTARTVAAGGATPQEMISGLHNRDWPTLWAASELGRIPRDGADDFAGSEIGTAAAGLPVDFSLWIERLERYAWELAEAISAGTDHDIDLTGLPMLKRSMRSEGQSGRTGGTKQGDAKKAALHRFRTHFVGRASGRGPIFDLGLAVLDPSERSRIMLTNDGAALLRELDGFGPLRKSPIPPAWRDAFLAHLARRVPADFEFLAQIVKMIASGEATRDDLTKAVTTLLIAAGDKSPSDVVISMNVAGYIARGREWGLISPKQGPGQLYMLMPDALEALETAERDAAA